MAKERIDFEKVDFFELLANTADETKITLVMDILGLVRKGDASAVRLLEKALLTSMPDEKNRPIPILMGATQTKNALQVDNSTAKDPQSSKTA